MSFYLELTEDEMELLLEVCYERKHYYEDHIYYGESYNFLDKYLAFEDLTAFLFHSLIAVGDDEAISQGSRRLIPKPDYEHLKQREAGDGVSLDHPDHLKQEVSNG